MTAERINPTTANLEKIGAWLDALANETDQARHSAAFTAYLRALTRFWRYSHHNTVLIFTQRPTAERVNSRKRWEEWGYTLKSGEWRNAIQILCPHFRKVTDEQTGEEREVLTRFTTGYIYDETQVTAGPHAQPLTAPWLEIAGDHAVLYGLLLRVCRHLAIMVEIRDDMPVGHHGSSD